MRRLALLVALAAACGPKLPPRAVIEHDLGPYRYRRYQQVLDIELPITDNPAIGHTATYVRGGDNIRLAPVFVTVYTQAAGLTETARTRLRGLDGYAFGVEKQDGSYVFRLKGEGGDGWLVWVSGAQLVKLGVPQGEPDVPADIVSAYLAQYPSDLDREGHAKKGAVSSGPAKADATAP